MQTIVILVCQQSSSESFKNKDIPSNECHGYDTKQSDGMAPGSLNKFPDFFRMGIFIDSTHMKI